MEEENINLLISTFAGLDLPRTLSLPVRASTSIRDALEMIYERVPCGGQSLIVTTTSNRQVRSSSVEAISTLLFDSHDAFLPLRLSSRLRGGKGGFGSQLRAAGGRMSSRKKRNQQNQLQNGSNRNLDGRRLNTVDTAKKLAKHLAEKPDMDRREKEEKRKRWETVVELANKREEEIKSGKMGAGQGRLDAEYVESKELAEEKTRDAVLKAMRDGMPEIERTGSETSIDADGGKSEDDVVPASEISSADERVGKLEEVDSVLEMDKVGKVPEAEEVVEVVNAVEPGTSMHTDEPIRTLFGWDDDEDESEEDEPIAFAEPVLAYTGKGKGKAM